MSTSQATKPGSRADFWIYEAGTGVWRTARRPLRCCECKKNTIQPGDRYLDTGERSGTWATFKVCLTHANEADK